MSRPCHCTPDPPTAPYRTGTDCPRCWAWHFRPDARAAWGGDPADCPPEPAAPAPPPAAKPGRVPLAAWTPCVHEGDILEACQTCGPKGHRHVRECDLHGRCTREAVGPRVRACRDCADYRPDPALLPAPPAPPPAAPPAAGEPAVLFVSHYLERDGAPTVLANLVTRLRHCRPTVFSFRDGPLRGRYEAAGVRVVVGDRPDPAGFDLVVANTAAAAPAVRAAVAAGVPVVWLIHEATPDWTGNRADLADLMPRAFACVFPSPACRDAFAGLRPANPQVIPALAPPGPVTDRPAARAALGLGDDTFLAVTFGRDEPRKGQADIRAACAGLPGVRLACVHGDPRPHDWLAAADLYVCASREEAFPLSTQEAAAAGVPVVSTPAGLLSGVAGDVYRPGDVGGLRALVEKHLARRRLGDRRPRPGYHRTLAWHEDLFRAAAGRLPRPAAGLRVVYHVAGIGPLWQGIVAEQLDQLRAAGLTSVLCTHVGAGLADLQRLARERAIELTVCSSDKDVTLYERPGIRLVHRLAHAGDEPVLYLHSKGVSRTAPEDAFNHDWRRLMMREVVGGWRERVADIEAGHDAVGVNWWTAPGMTHFSGNFWVASAAWLRRLPDPDAHYQTRWSCEQYVGSVPGCRAKSLLCGDRKFWAEDRPVLAALVGDPAGPHPCAVDPTHVGMIRAELMTGKYRRVLEVGCHHGAATRAFLDAVRAGAVAEAHLCEPAVTPELERLVAGVPGVTLHRERSVELLARDADWDLVFLDGDHAEATVAEELRLLVAAGVPAVLAHDVSPAARERYGVAGGPSLAGPTLRAAGYAVEVDDAPRPGERTERGLLVARRPQQSPK